MNTPDRSEYAEDAMQCEPTQLMGAVKRGEAGAFDSLVVNLRGRAFQIARSLVGSRDDAMELSQETFLKVFKARSTYREGDPFLPWFHRILRNTCFSFLRKRNRLKRRSISETAPGQEDDGDWELVDESPGPTEVLEQDERAKAFWSAFRTLSARDREILSLRHFKDLSYRELAESLGIPTGTVMSRLFHARRRLREKLAGHLDEDFVLEAVAMKTEETR